jgi:RNA polymerase sigma-70 factor, ECF subfamily
VRVRTVGGMTAAPLSDPDIFRDAYVRYGRRAFLAARRVLGDDARAEDAAQDAFIRLWSNPTGYSPARGDLGTYVAMMARSRALDLWRSEHSRERAAERLLEALTAEAGIGGDPAEAVERSDLRAAVRTAMRTLPPPQREALVLAHWGGLTMAEIASRTGVPLGTVKGRLRLGLAKLAAAPALR